jgi:PAS domain S-box-containing protein
VGRIIAEEVLMAASPRTTTRSRPTRGKDAGQPEPAEHAVLPGIEFHTFLDTLGVAVYTTDAEGGITYFNEAAVALWGRRPELGEQWCGSWRLYWPDGRPMAHDECPMAIALKEDRPIRGVEAELERLDGTRAVFMAYPTPMHDSSERLVGAVNVLVDVTERRKAEEALRAAAEALAASNQVKDEFLGLVSHELRTPVTTIFGNAHLLRGRAGLLATEETDSMLTDIADESNRLLGIIENLLLLTRLGSGTPPDQEPQLLAHVARNAVEGYRKHHPERSIALVVEPGQMVVEADRGHLEMLLDNLLTNATKYSPASTEIDVRVSSDRQEACVAVLDRGIGIGDADPGQLFTAFYRTEAAKMRTAGLGIGLAVCQRIVDSLGGRLWARPREGGGTEAGFALPLAVVSPD